MSTTQSIRTIPAPQLAEGQILMWSEFSTPEPLLVIRIRTERFEVEGQGEIEQLAIDTTLPTDPYGYRGTVFVKLDQTVDIAV